MKTRPGVMDYVRCPWTLTKLDVAIQKPQLVLYDNRADYILYSYSIGNGHSESCVPPMHMR